MKYVCPIALHVLVSAAANGQCWELQSPYTSVGVAGAQPTVRSMTMWDADGPGGAAPVLAVVGRFAKAGNVLAENVAFWDGSGWTSPGGGLRLGTPPTNPYLEQCAVADFDGAGPLGSWLIVGGEFLGPNGGLPLVAWDGSGWRQLPLSPSATAVRDLFVFDPDGPSGPLGDRLYVVSNHVRLEEIGPNSRVPIPVPAPSGYIPDFLWLTDWDSDGPGPAPRRVAVAVSVFSSGQPRVTDVYFLEDGVLRNPLGSIAGSASDIERADLDGDGPQPEQLFLGVADPTSSAFVWEPGSGWVRMGTAADGCAGFLAVDPDAAGPAPAVLYSRRGSGVRGVSRWTGSSWLDLGSSASVVALASMDFDGPGGAAPVVVAGGAMVRMPDSSTVVVNGIAKLAGSQWQPINTGTNGPVSRVAPWDHDSDPQTPPRIVAAGSFATIEGAATGPIGVFDGAAWTSALYQPIPASATYTGPLGVFDPDGAGPQPSSVFVSGVFSGIGARPVQNIARWDGAAYWPLASGITCTTGCGKAMQVFDADGPGPLPAELIIAGTFTVVGNSSYVNIARWNGTTWAPLGAGLNGPVASLHLLDIDGDGPLPPRLLAAGAYTGTGTVTLPGMAIWDGAAWSSLPSGSRASGLITVWDPDGAGPELPRLVTASGDSVSAWNGTGWSRLGSQSIRFTSESSIGQVRAIASVDPDGEGPRPALLIAAGTFDRYGMWSMRNIAVWMYGEWRPFAASIGTLISGMVPFDPDGPGPEPVRVLIESADTFSPRSFSLVGLPPWIESQPADVARYEGAEIELSVAAEADAAAAYQWRKNGVPLIDGYETGGDLTGINSPTLRVQNAAPSDSGRYSCFVMGACGVATSAEAVVLVRCVADFNADGGVDGSDVGDFFRAWEAGDALADVDENGGVDGPDVERFFSLWELGSC